MLESELERKAVAKAREAGILTYKFTSPSNRGVPDRIFMVKEKMFFIEFKALGKKPTALQKREHARIEEAGFPVFVVDREEDLDHIFYLALFP